MTSSSSSSSSGSSSGSATMLRALRGAPRSARNLVVTVPLFGAVSLRGIRDKFPQAESIAFAPGGITQLDDAAATTLTCIDCARNRLTAAAVADLASADGLLVLLAAHNDIQDDVARLPPSLEHLDLAHNRVRSLPDDLPPSLKTLEVQHNLLAELDVGAARALRRVDASHNLEPFTLRRPLDALVERLVPPNTRVERAPPAPAPAPRAFYGIDDILSDDDDVDVPGVVHHAHSWIRRGQDGGQDGDKKKKKKEADGGEDEDGEEEEDGGEDEDAVAGGEIARAPMSYSAKYRAGVQAYFAARAAYHREVRKRPVGGALCPQCSRFGGAVFSGRDQKYSMRCGARPDPCDLGVGKDIDRGKFLAVRVHAAALHDRIVRAREAVIRQKMQTLLGYLPAATAAAQFKNQRDRYNGLLEQWEEFNARSDCLLFDPARAKRRADARKIIKASLVDVRASVDARNWPDAARAQRSVIAPISLDIDRDSYSSRETRSRDTGGFTELTVIARHTDLAHEIFNVGQPI